MDEVSNVFVCLMGLGTVFVGLICIIVLCIVIGRLCRYAEARGTPAPLPAGAPLPIQPETTDTPVQERDAVIAAITAVLMAAASDRPRNIPGRKIAAPSRRIVLPVEPPFIPPVCRTPQRPISVRKPTPLRNQRQEMISAVSAAIAEENGGSLSGIRILSFKKVD